MNTFSQSVSQSGESFRSANKMSRINHQFLIPAPYSSFSVASLLKFHGVLGGDSSVCELEEVLQCPRWRQQFYVFQSYIYLNIPLPDILSPI